MSVAGLFLAGVACWLLACGVVLGMAWLWPRQSGRHALLLLEDEHTVWQTRETKK